MEGTIYRRKFHSVEGTIPVEQERLRATRSRFEDAEPAYKRIRDDLTRLGLKGITLEKYKNHGSRGFYVQVRGERVANVELSPALSGRDGLRELFTRIEPSAPEQVLEAIAAGMNVAPQDPQRELASRYV